MEQRDEDMSNISSETQKNKPLNEQKIGIEEHSMPTYTLAKFHERQVAKCPFKQLFRGNGI